MVLQKLMLMAGIFLVSAAYSYMRFGSRRSEANSVLVVIICGACLVASSILCMIDAWEYAISAMAGILAGYAADRLRDLAEEIIDEISSIL